MESIDFYYKGIEEFNKKNYLSAIEYFKISGSLENHYKTYEMLFQCWKAVSNMNEAYDYIKKAYVLNSANDKVAYEYAETSVQFGDKESAQKVLTEILKRNPTYKKAKQLLDLI